MRLDGSFRHHQGIGDLTVGFALSNKPHNLAFTLREPTKGCFGRAVWRDEFFPGQRTERSLQEVFAQVAIINGACLGVDYLSR